MDPLSENSMREWSFRVEGVTAPGEVMCIVGSCQELGEWDPKRVVPMSIIPDGEASSNTTSSAMSSRSHLFVPSENIGVTPTTCETNRSSS